MTEYSVSEDARSNKNAGVMAPLHTFYQVFFTTVDTTAQLYDPFVKSVARAQLEALGYFNRRTQAWMQLTQRAAHCHSPMDFANEQVRFWQSAHHDTADAARRMLETVMPIARQPSFQFDQEQKTARDFITFPQFRDTPRPASKNRETEREAA
jgi:hypothetical protein